MRNKFEILAPAGSYETFLAVLQAGADAVYFGGEMFGARAYAGNLSQEEILQAIDYAHIHNKRAYLTVNTLLKNNEIFGRLYEYIAPLYEAGLDGVIVQDYGVMKFIHDNFPLMEIHASTQMTITDGRYTDFLKKYNVTRIVPAREMSLEDIKKIRKYTDMEIECFVHGALCYSYSGLCFMSSFIGGRSGNRGRCAQPCRLEYCNKNLLSLKDLCTLDILPDILESGVFSLKIEGRMKSPVYAAGVTSIYRKYVDMYIEKGRKGYIVSQTDKDKLLMLFDRGGMTNGYYVMHNGPEMIANENKSDKSLREKELFEKEIADKYINRTLKEKINISGSFIDGSEASLTIYDDEGNCITENGPIIERALSRSMSKDDIIKQINKLGNTYYESDCINISVSDNVFIPNKTINELRRNAIDTFSESILSKYKRKANIVSYNFSENNNANEAIVARVSTFEQAVTCIDMKVDRIVVECELFSDEELNTIKNKCLDLDVECFYGLPRVFKGENILHNKPDFDGYYVRNMAEYEYLLKNNVKGVYVADYTVYGFNDIAVNVLYETGFNEVVYPIELNEKEILHLKNPMGEIVVYGRIPLMITANCIDKTLGKCHMPKPSFGTIIDRKKAVLPYLSACKYCYNVIYNSVPIYLFDKISEISPNKKANYSLCFTDESKDTVNEIVSMAKMALIYEKKPSKIPDNYTRGHYTRGVE